MTPSRIPLLLLVLLVAGCGGGSSTSAPSQPIAFTVNDEGWGEIWLMDESGQGRKQLTDARPEGSESSGSTSPSWSPDRKHIAYAGVGNSVVADPAFEDIYVMDADGTNSKQLTHNTVPDFSPDWSPDGKKIVFSHASVVTEAPLSALYVMDADGSHQKLLYRVNDALLVTADWSPDGKHIAFTQVTYPNTTTVASIYVINSDGTGAKRIAGDAAEPAWSPDGTHIAFATGRDHFGRTCVPQCQANDEIYVADATGANPRRLTTDKAEDTSPTWSPDGTQIAFVSDRTSRETQNEIFVVDASGGEAKRITNNDVWDLEPDWK